METKRDIAESLRLREKGKQNYSLAITYTVRRAIIIIKQLIFGKK